MKRLIFVTMAMLSMLLGSSCTGRNENLAFRKAAYHSSSYDYNLTAQLVTDGIVADEAPKWLSVMLNGETVGKREREIIIDDSPHSNLPARGKKLVLGMDFVNYGLDADEAKVLYFNADRVRKEKVFPLKGKAENDRIRLEFNSDKDNTEWYIVGVEFYKGGQRVKVMPSEYFCSAWRSEGAGEQWVYVDLGERCSLDEAVLHWINPAKSFTIQTSDDAISWADAASVQDNEQNLTKTGIAAKARYVRVLCHESLNGEPYELSEFEVYGKGSCCAKPAANAGVQSWALQRASLVQDGGEQIASADYDVQAWLPATVPGTVLLNYIRAGAVPDPNYSDNQLQISESFFNSDFWYRGVLKAEDKGGRCYLNFDGINWKADIFFNGKAIGRIEGAFKQGVFDVTDLLKKGDNYVAVHIIKNEHPGRVKEQTAFTADANGGILGADNATFHASIGWDWIPTVRGRNHGIWNDVYFTYSGDVTIEEPFISTEFPGLPDLGVAEVSAQMLVRNHADHAVQGVLKGSFGEHCFQRELSLEAGESRLLEFNSQDSPELRIQNPRVWWPNGYGEPELYDVKLCFQLDGVCSDLVEMKAGVRQMTWEESDFVCRDKTAPFGVSNRRLSLFVNGRRFIGFGGNWGFSEHNLDYSAEQYDAAVRYHRDMNFTMIRNWVGQIGDNEFYEACDRHGIMVWQDFWLANPYDGPDPYYNDLFMDNAYDFVKRIRNHPSIGLYVGRNEGNPPAVLDNALRELVAAEHPGMHYISHSAADVVSGGGPYRALPIEEYYNLWGADKMHSERGMPNVMNYESMVLSMKESEMCPLNTVEHPNNAYGLHDYCLKSAQSASSFNDMLHKAFGEPQSAQQFTQWAQWINYNGYRAMFESRSYARRGLLLWMSHPAWPSNVWQTYDYYLDPTAAYFGCKKACEPLHVQWNASNNHIEVVNYRAGDCRNLTVLAQVLDQNGKLQWEKSIAVDAAEDQTVDCFEVQADADMLTDTYFIRLKLSDAEGKLVSENFYWEGKERGNYKSLLSLPKADLALDLKTEKIETDSIVCGKDWVVRGTVTNRSNTPALMVRLALQTAKSAQRITPAIYSDNYFFLMPGESREVCVSAHESDCFGQKPVLVVK